MLPMETVRSLLPACPPATRKLSSLSSSSLGTLGRGSGQGQGLHAGHEAAHLLLLLLIPGEHGGSPLSRSAGEGRVRGGGMVKEEEFNM